MSYDRWLTTNAAAERGEEIEAAIDEYLEKVGYKTGISCPECFRKRTLRMYSKLPAFLHTLYCNHGDCDFIFENSALFSEADLTQIARSTAFKRIMEERGE